MPHGSRRSPPLHGPPGAPHRFDERRRSLSPGGRRDESYRQGPPRDQGGYGMGREPMRGRGGYPAAFDNRSRPIEGRRRNSPPPRQYVERGRGAPRGRGGRGRWSISQSGKHLTEMFQVEKRREKEREQLGLHPFRVICKLEGYFKSTQHKY